MGSQCLTVVLHAGSFFRTRAYAALTPDGVLKGDKFMCASRVYSVGGDVLFFFFPFRSGVFSIVSCCNGRAMCGALIGEDASCCMADLTLHFF